MTNYKNTKVLEDNNGILNQIALFPVRVALQVDLLDHRPDRAAGCGDRGAGAVDRGRHRQPDHCRRNCGDSAGTGGVADDHR